MFHGKKYSLPECHNIPGYSACRNSLRFPTTIWVAFVWSGLICGKFLESTLTRYVEFPSATYPFSLDIQVCCHNNPHVGFFALDALRQLAMRFLEKEELPHFKFQKDFLRPFEYTMTHNSNPDVRDMVITHSIRICNPSLIITTGSSMSATNDSS